MEVAVYTPVAASYMTGLESTVVGNFPRMHFLFTEAYDGMTICQDFVLLNGFKYRLNTCWNGFYITRSLTFLGNHGNQPEFIGKCCKIMENAQ